MGGGKKKCTQHLYTYDTFGNLLSETEYARTGYASPSEAHAAGMDAYTYSYKYTDASWKDLLTTYRGQTITYDAAGNPLSYYNGQSYTFTWEDGNQLASATVGGKTLTFEYNSDGIRTKKNISGSATYYYRLNGTKVVEMEVASVSSSTTDRYVFIYDADGNPHEIHKYAAGATTPTKYFYVLNLQGDIIQLRDTSNAVVANYTYDAWGKLLSVKNASGSTISDATHIANVNPIRYRGYFYDTETKLYYCKSRYYDPQVKRFINADVLLSTGTGFLGYNMFAYCNNNPVMYSDPSGEWPGYVHNKVIDHIVEKYNEAKGPTMYKEQRINYSPSTILSTLRAYGRADLINENGYVWEVKRNRGNQVKNGQEQIKNYITNTWDKNPNLELHLGYAIDSGHFEFTDGDTKYNVWYAYMGEGVIGYDYTKSKDWDKIKDTAKDVALDIAPYAIATFAIALGFLLGGPAGATVGGTSLLPVFG